MKLEGRIEWPSSLEYPMTRNVCELVVPHVLQNDSGRCHFTNKGCHRWAVSLDDQHLLQRLWHFRIRQCHEKNRRLIRRLWAGFAGLDECGKRRGI